MTPISLLEPAASLHSTDFLHPSHSALMAGEILLQTQSHGMCGATVVADAYLPVDCDTVWQGLTNYPRWVEYLPDMTSSRLLQTDDRGGKLLHQTARKQCLMLSLDIEIYLRVFEIQRGQTRQIQFCMERGSFADFMADSKVRPYAGGTLLTYTVQGTPLIPVPSAIVQQLIRINFAQNFRAMCQRICL